MWKLAQNLSFFSVTKPEKPEQCSSTQLLGMLNFDSISVKKPSRKFYLCIIGFNFSGVRSFQKPRCTMGMGVIRIHNEILWNWWKPIYFYT